MVGCAVRCCRSRSSKTIESGISFHGIPTIVSNQCLTIKELSEKRRNAWLRCLNQIRYFQPGALKSPIKICSKHFISGKPAKLYDFNNPDWIPTLNLDYEKPCFAAFKESLALRNELHQSLPTSSTQELTWGERLYQSLPAMAVENSELNKNLTSSSMEESVPSLTSGTLSNVTENYEIKDIEELNHQPPFSLIKFSSNHLVDAISESPSKCPHSNHAQGLNQSELNASMDETTQFLQRMHTKNENLCHSEGNGFIITTLKKRLKEQKLFVAQLSRKINLLEKEKHAMMKQIIELEQLLRKQQDTCNLE